MQVYLIITKEWLLLMITLYTAPGCASCLKAKKWLDGHNINYKIHNIFTQPLTPEDIKGILSLTENGTEEILSKRSKRYEKLEDNLEQLSLSELCNVIEDDPHILRRPIIKDDHCLQIGYNAEDIRKFLPHETRQSELLEAMARVHEFPEAITLEELGLEWHKNCCCLYTIAILTFKNWLWNTVYL